MSDTGYSTGLPTNSGPIGMLSNLRDTVFNRSNFIDKSINANVVDNRKYTLGPTGLENLHKSISLDASHDANIKNKPECSPNTRIKILNRISDWMNDTNSKYKILWLHGPAGAGKSAIAQTAMKRAMQERRLGASFFFSRGAEGRSTAERLFPTIAYQLATNIPELAPAVNSVMLDNRDLPSKDLETQFRELIDRPVRDIKTLPYPLIGIDGINECEDSTVQEKLLTIIGNSVKSNLPLLFLFLSRPEPHIEALFTRKFGQFTQQLILETSPESLGDISRYLRAGFADIRQRHRHYIRNVPQPWPSEHDLWMLCDRSSGHFIYGMTVLKFVGGDEYLNPVEQLNTILQRSPSTRPILYSSPFSEIDQLYLQVLSSHPDVPQLCRILALLVTTDFNLYFSFLDDLLKFDQGTTAASLYNMHSLIKITRLDSIDRRSPFHHASFREFLLDPRRSQSFFIDTGKTEKWVAEACVDLLICWIKEPQQENQVYMPEVTGPSYHVSDWHRNVVSMCNYLKYTLQRKGMVPHFARLIKAIPLRPAVPSKPVFYILHQLAEKLNTDVLNLPRFLSLWNSIPLYRLHAAYKAYLLEERSSALRFLISPPCIFGLDLLPVNILAKFYKIDPCALIQECSPLLKPFILATTFGQPIVNGYTPLTLNIQFSRYVSMTSPFKKYLCDTKLKEESMIKLGEQCFQFLITETGQETSDWAATALNHMSVRVLKANTDNIVLYLSKLRMQPPTPGGNAPLGRDPHILILGRMAWQLNYEREEDADIIAKIARELLYLKNNSPLPASVKIFPRFLNKTPNANLSWSIDIGDIDSLEPHSFNLYCPHLSDDFRFFESDFNHRIFRFLMDSRRAGAFFVPRDILRQDLETLSRNATLT